LPPDEITYSQISVSMGCSERMLRRISSSTICNSSFIEESQHSDIVRSIW